MYKSRLVAAPIYLKFIVHIHMHTHIYMYTYKHTYTHRYTCTHKHRGTNTRTHMHTCTHTQTHMYTYTHIHIQYTNIRDATIHILGVSIYISLLLYHDTAIYGIVCNS